MIDWQFFFLAWELKGKYPAILREPAARELFDDANTMLDKIIAEQTLQASGAYGFWPAHSDGDDIVIDTGPEALRVPMLRQHTPLKPACGATDAWPTTLRPPGGTNIGAFAVAIHGAEQGRLPVSRPPTTTTRRSW